MLTFQKLRDANVARQRAYDPDNQISMLYRAVELGGEAGEALNLAKKIERATLGLQGSRASLEELARELADVVICADLLAMHVGIDLGETVQDTFNAKSKELSLDIFLW